MKRDGDGTAEPGSLADLSGPGAPEVFVVEAELSSNPRPLPALPRGWVQPGLPGSLESP